MKDIIIFGWDAEITQIMPELNANTNSTNNEFCCCKNLDLFDAKCNSKLFDSIRFDSM